MYICYVYYVHASTQPGQKKAADPLKLKLQTVVNYLMRDGAGHGQTTEPKSTLNYWLNSLALYLYILTDKYIILLKLNKKMKTMYFIYTETIFKRQAALVTQQVNIL